MKFAQKTGYEASLNSGQSLTSQRITHAHFKIFLSVPKEFNTQNAHMLLGVRDSNSNISDVQFEWVESPLRSSNLVRNQKKKEGAK